jgi:hypothetical protein
MDRAYRSTTVDHNIEAGDKVRLENDLGHLNAGETFRVLAVVDNGKTLTLAGEEGTWSANHFSVLRKKAHERIVIEPAAQQEAKSVTIKIDHVMMKAGPETIANLQLSNYPAARVLIEQVPYFVETDKAANILADHNHVNLIAQVWGHSAFLVYTPSTRITNIIMDMDVFDGYLQRHETIFGAIAAAVQEADIMFDNWSRTGKDTTLMAFLPDLATDADDLMGDPD